MTIKHLAPGERDIGQVVQVVRQLMQGRDDASGTVKLTANSVTTGVTAAVNCASGSEVFLFPASAHAAAEFGTIYVSSVSNGSFVVTHNNTATTDRLFFWTTRG